MSSPTSRTLELLRAEGWTPAVVERHNTFSHKKNDLFGCIDIVAMKPGHPILGVQATSDSNHAARREKASKEPRLITWLATGSLFEVWSWKKRPAYRKDGSRAKRDQWAVRRESVRGIDVLGEVVPRATHADHVAAHIAMHKRLAHGP